MATKSITKNIAIHNKHFAKSLISALENAAGKTGKDVVLQKPYLEASNDTIKKIFNKKI